MSLEDLKSECELSNEDLENISDEHLVILLGIVKDFKSNYKSYEDTARFIANSLQECEQVHSVRYRVKNVTHLVNKIVRKWNKNIDKYKNISVQNYKEIITDLIGVRALHLYSNRWNVIDAFICDNWRINPKERKVYYYNKADKVPNELILNGMKTEEHPRGYRSKHYVIETMPTKQSINVEIQVRTIMEEAWSEIDHDMNYPISLEDELLKGDLGNLNQVCNASDKMGATLKDRVDCLNKSNRLQKKELKNGENSAMGLTTRQQIPAELGVRSLQKIEAKSVHDLMSALSGLELHQSSSLTEIIEGLIGIQNGEIPFGGSLEKALPVISDVAKLLSPNSNFRQELVELGLGEEVNFMAKNIEKIAKMIKSDFHDAEKIELKLVGENKSAQSLFY